MSLELFSCKEKVAVVIGGGGHICSRLAEGLAAAGAQVVVADLRLEKAEKVCNDINERFPNSTRAIQVDAGSLASLTKLVNDVLSFYQGIDVVVNGAGINSPKPFLELTED